MSYKGLFKRFLLLLTNPDEAWKAIDSEQKTDVLYSSFIYPLIALCSLATFLSSLMYTGSTAPYPIFQEALTASCLTAIALFGGVYSCVFLLGKILSNSRFKDISISNVQLTKLVGYAFVVVFAFFVLSSFLPKLAMIFFIAQFYNIYIIWQGLNSIIAKDHEQKLIISCVIGVTILVVPSVLKFIFSFIV